jgi:hypothetical protein
MPKLPPQEIKKYALRKILTKGMKYQRPEKFYISSEAKLILTPITEVTAATTAEKYEIRQGNATVQNVGPW